MKKKLIMFTLIFIVIVLISSLIPYLQQRSSGGKQMVRFCSMNIGNALDAPRYTPWDVQMKSEYFKAIKQAGFNAVRLPVRFSDYAKDNPNYALDPTFMKKLDGYLQDALQQHLYVILDFHHFEEIMQDPEQYHACFLSIWEQLSERYQNYSSHLLFEVLNEPKDNLNGGLWNQYLGEAIHIIRKTNPTRKIIVGPDNYYSLYRLDALQIPTDRNLIVSFHYYEPNNFTFQANPYLGFSQYHDIQWTGTNQEVSEIHERFARVKRWADQHHVPVYLGEFGANNQAPYESRLRWTEEVREQAEHFGFSWGYWELASYFGIYNAQTGKWDKAMLKTLLPDK
ncbi:glycoside hydrolase family 5 protein [Sporolactobacillus kofuensis]|uniref:Glycoside hydrolase family 5 protein n=1 Tax=Sporolactobacillus kofuensis TaxID=269672 RepID=A0ABW1WEC3_9BACL|nr:glycoside hydrolase family 5 protein [Sporolactobacillus kofuensis]MCO7174844.1 glycoside hydrolase family 5 protein [Sporolactobacillus kofuensis]